MKKINSLDELVKLVGQDVVDKCFIENFMLLIAQAKRQQDLDNKCATMTEDEMYDYIDRIGRTELFDEIKDVNSDEYVLVRPNQPHPYPRYLKAVRVSLVSQGYDEYWVETEFRDALEKRYLKKKKSGSGA